MGTFLVNFHIRSDNRKSASGALKKVLDQGGWMAGPHDGWVSFWDEQASQQSEERIRSVAEDVSRSLSVPLVAFLIHDSDVFCYWLYEAGHLLDEFNSCPTYWGDLEIDETRLQANLDAFLRICRTGIKPEALQEILVQDSHDARAAGEPRAFVFAEERLTKLAPLLGLREDIALLDFSSIGSEVSAKAIGARWVGTGKPPVDSDEPLEAEAEQQRFMKKAPLHAAAERDDITAIKQLIAAGRDIDEMPGGFQVTPLAMAAAMGNPQTIQALVELGADLHKKGREGASPIRCAVQASKIDNVRLLVKLGADIADYASEMGTLLHLAIIMRSSPELILALLDLGADPERMNEKELKPIDVVRGNRQAFESLLSMMSNPADQRERLDEMHRNLIEVEQLLSRGRP